MYDKFAVAICPEDLICAASMSAPDQPDSPSLFDRTLNECRELYVSSGRLCAQEYPHLIAKDGEKFVELMDDLHRALVVKVYFTVCQADRKWSQGERTLAELLIEHLWKQRLTGEQLKTAAQRLSQDAEKLKWYALVRPFDQIVPLRDRVGTLETIVMRLANLVARHDGKLNDKEAAAIKSIQDELHHHLRPIPIDEPTEHDESNAASTQAIESLKNESGDIRAVTRVPKAQADIKPGQAGKPDLRVSLEDALAELDGLIGLDCVKEEVRTLTNYLKLQQRRDKAGLPSTDMSLHMVFTGNPGTGKTTVARILGKIFGAMGVLKKGHLVETDRSGLVADYMGQTATKTQAKINEALDGVLFIDEAYSLVSKEGQDVYGSEAIQTLLKRAEDDRKRLVVILAGYPDEIDALLKSNPGLSSRFDRLLHFDDYSPIELARIFGWLCEKNHYKLAAGSRAKLMLGLAELHRARDRHFGNGRAVRNLFEQAVRRMANRIADMREISQEALMLLDAADVEFDDLPADVKLDADDDCRFNVSCPECSQISKAPGSYLGKKVRCRKCEHDFTAEWGEPAKNDSEPEH
jgi:SpoVK/Ycf46/Vps4 family AAA+-type ATPase